MKKKRILGIALCAALLIAGENRREYSRLSQEYEQRIADFEPCRITEMQVSV